MNEYKLGYRDLEELEHMHPARLDGMKWEDHVRVASTVLPSGRRQYQVKHSTSGDVLSRHGDIMEANDEAQRRNAGKWR